MNQQFDRIVSLINQDNFNLIQSKRILVVGLGGVGGYAVESLVRSGINKIVICDNDVVDMSNINRQIITNVNVVGKKKTTLFKERILAINPECEVDCIDSFIKDDNFKILFEKKIDYVVDCIDTMSSKVALWQYCQDNNIKLISSLGTAKRIDPTKLTITTLDKTQNDPMARALRNIARKRKVSLDVNVVFSNETPINNDEKLGSMIFVVATAGLMCGYYVISDIIQKGNR